MSKTFRKEVEQGIALICNSIGFNKKKYYFVKKIDENSSATLQFGISTHVSKNHIYVDFNVGISLKNVETLFAKLTGNDHRLFDSSIHIQIGYLTPGNSYKEWIFEENSDNSHVFEDMLSYIKTYGFEYFEQMVNINNMLDAFIKGKHTNLREARDRNIPILYYLIGDKNKGLEFIEEALERQKTPLSEAQMARLIKLAGPGGQVFIGGGIGKVDPEYLKFIERYNELT